MGRRTLIAAALACALLSACATSVNPAGPGAGGASGVYVGGDGGR